MVVLAEHWNLPGLQKALDILERDCVPMPTEMNDPHNKPWLCFIPDKVAGYQRKSFSYK